MDFHLLRRVTRRFAQLQRHTFMCCVPASETRCLLLTELLGSGPLSVRDLAERLGSDSPWVSRAVEQLRAQGFVTRTEDQEDRRRVLVKLTAEGAAEARELQAALNRQAERILRRIPEERRDAVVAALEELSRALDAEYAEERAALAQAVVL